MENSTSAIPEGSASTKQPRRLYNVNTENISSQCDAAMKLLSDKDSICKIGEIMQDKHEDVSIIKDYVEKNTIVKSQIESMIKDRDTSGISRKKAMQMKKQVMKSQNLARQKIEQIGVVVITKARKSKAVMKPSVFLDTLKDQGWSQTDIGDGISIIYDPTEHRKNTRASKIASITVAGDVYVVLHNADGELITLSMTEFDARFPPKGRYT